MVDEWTITEKGQKVLDMLEDETFCSNCGEIHKKKVERCPHCGYKSRMIVLAPKPGTPIVPDIYKKVIEEEW